jgi:hypothetical protein
VCQKTLISSSFFSSSHLSFPRVLNPDMWQSNSSRIEPITQPKVPSQKHHSHSTSLIHLLHLATINYAVPNPIPHSPLMSVIPDLSGITLTRLTTSPNTSRNKRWSWHTLRHLNIMLGSLVSVKQTLESCLPGTVLFVIFGHTRGQPYGDAATCTRKLRRCVEPNNI